MIEPVMIVLYVDNIETSSPFYQKLLGLKPVEASETFHQFTLSNGMSIGLKTRHSVSPPSNSHSNDNNELAFVVNDREKVDVFFSNSKELGIQTSHKPALESYGYTFVGLDPDGNRLRFASLNV